MTTGTVKFFNVEAGLGVISPEQGGEVFVYASNIPSDDDKALQVGQEVEFDVAPGHGGDEARNVRRLPRIRFKSHRALLSAVERAPDGMARREGRGFVASYGQGRRCAASGCPTTLSRYNRHSVCWLHSPGGGGRLS